MPTDSIRPHHLPARVLSEMCAEFGLEEAPEECDLESVEITGVRSDHRQVESGDLFVALPGGRTHGAHFIADAEAAGAVAVLTDPHGARLAGETALPVLVVDDARLALGHIARWVYRTDPAQPRLFGVVGSIGKTSVTHLIADLFDRIGVACGLSSSIERRTTEVLALAELTTPEADELHALIARMREDGDRVAAIEVTPESISKQRVAGVEFDVVGPFNFDAEHHGDDAHSAERFLSEHRELLDPDCATRAVIYVDTEVGRELVQAARVPVSTISFNPEANADWLVSWEREDYGTTFEVRGHDDRAVRSHTSKPGLLTALNAAAAIVMVAEAGWATEQIQDALERTGGFDVKIPGRLERVEMSAKGVRGYVDTDLTLAGLRSALSALRVEAVRLTAVIHPRESLVEGAAEVLARLSDRVIVVGDANAADAVRAAGASTSSCPDLPTALQAAFEDVERGDVVLLVEPHADDLREIDEGEVTDPTIDLLRRAFDDADL